MPTLHIPQHQLAEWGQAWRGTPDGTGPQRPDCFDRSQGIEFGQVFDQAFGTALAAMLGNIPVVTPNARALTPAGDDCVEVGATRVIGGIRPQNYDAAYRPDGPRVVFDSKTLNERSSIRKNWQNMINDLASEAATVHTRFPFCIVAFLVVLPAPALAAPQAQAISSTLIRLGSRKDELDQHHLAEAIAMVVWDPDTGEVDPNVPAPNSNIRLEAIHERIYDSYLDRYQHLPPHT